MDPKESEKLELAIREAVVAVMARHGVDGARAAEHDAWRKRPEYVESVIRVIENASSQIVHK